MGIRQHILVAVVSVTLSSATPGLASEPYAPSEITKIAFLGTGTPNADPEHSGPSVAIIVNLRPYIVDFGPGVIRQASALSAEYGGPLGGFDVTSITRAFLTHLHSDHTTGYPDLILTPWVLGREEALEVYGPEGLQKMTDHILQAYTEDIRMRLYGKEAANNLGWRVKVHEIEEGHIYEDKNVTVEAFPVLHGSWPQAFGFKFSTPDRSVCISGDARPSEIGKRLLLDNATISGVLDRLADGGWIVKQTDERDRRALRIFPSDKALDLTARVVAVRDEANDQILAGLSLEEKVLLKRLLRDIR